MQEELMTIAARFACKASYKARRVFITFCGTDILVDGDVVLALSGARFETMASDNAHNPHVVTYSPAGADKPAAFAACGS
jgi:hypothetical protein